MPLALEFIAICLGTSTAGVALSLGWYKVTQRDSMDKDTVLFFAKLWYGFGVAVIVLGLLLKYG
jgi:hypothetical protein